MNRKANLKNFNQAKCSRILLILFGLTFATLCLICKCFERIVYLYRENVRNKGKE